MLQGHQAAVESASFSPDDQTIVPTGCDNAADSRWGRWDLNPHDLLGSTDFHPPTAFAAAETLS